MSFFTSALQAQPGGVKVKKIWDSAQHNAFTDLIRFNKSYYCSFREGSGHIPGTDGKVRILKSGDGWDWESVVLLEKQGTDLRDPKLSVTPDGRIMVIMGGSIYSDGKMLGRVPHVSYSDEAGTMFSDPEKATIDPEVVSGGDWIWRVTWHKDVGYAIDYQHDLEGGGSPTALYLLKTTDGKNYEKITKLEIDGFPNETTVRFDKKGTMYALIRREEGDRTGIWAYSEAPYSRWSFQKLSFRLGGPNFIFLNNNKVVVGTRAYEPEACTALYVGTKTGDFKEALRLPSGGDNSYPGMVLEKGRLLVSYYSAHEGKAAVYIAEIPIRNLKKYYQPAF